jgi:hypothetical protein
VYAIIAVAVAIDFWLARRYFGFLTGDEVEVLGAAWQHATGAWYGTWDIRNLLIPNLVVAPMLSLGSLLNVSAQQLLEIASLPFILAFATTVWLVYRLALRWAGDASAALAAAGLFAFHWIPLGFGSTVYPRTIAALCVTGAMLLVDGGAAACFLAGCLCGLAFADRFSEIVFLLPAFLFARRRGALLAGAAASVIVVSGVYDWVTWGAPFSSLRKFVAVTLMEPDFASLVKFQPPYWYLSNLPRWCALTLLPLLFLAWRDLRNAEGRGLRNAGMRTAACVAIPLFALSLVRHKELRYLQTLIPFLAVAGGIGLAKMNRRRIGWTLIILSIAWNLTGLRLFRKKTQPAVMAARVLAQSHVHAVALSQLWAYGDRFYLGRDMAIEDLGTPPRELGAALERADALSLYESDLTPADLDLIERHRFRRRWRFDDGPARAVVVFTRTPDATGGR